MGERSVRYVQYLAGRFLVSAGDGVFEVELDGGGGGGGGRDGRVRPLVEGVDVLAMRGAHVLTHDRVIDVTSGASLPLPQALRDAPIVAFVPLASAAARGELDGVVVASADMARPAAAAVCRVDRRGEVVWRTSAAPPRLLAGGDYVSQARRETGFQIEPMPPWEPAQWWMLGNELYVSGARVLAAFGEHPRSGIGICYGFDLKTGENVYRTLPAPYGEISAAAVSGSFLVGVQGYGAFETRLVDASGGIAQTWPSHGIVIDQPADAVARVIEMESSIPSKMHMATWRADGTVEKGVWLPGYYTSSPVVAADGSVVFWRDDALVRVSPDLQQLERLVETPCVGRAFARHLAGTVPGRVAFDWSATIELPDGFEYRRRLFVVELES